jgi:hypothetical protein
MTDNQEPASFNSWGQPPHRYRNFPRITVIDPAGSVYTPSRAAAIVVFLSSAGVLQYCTRATDPTKGWLMRLASSMTR